ncbi:MAG TPA: enoyl-CoA hydratase-related protein, partial [Puia sp.]
MKNETVSSASGAGVTNSNDKINMVDIPLSADARITVERRGQIVLIGINRPDMFNHINPVTFYGLSKAYYDFDNDTSLRAAILFGHGENFSRGNDVDAFSAL